MQDMLKELSADLDRHTNVIKRGIANEWRFVRSWFRSPLRTGAIASSSRSLARRMAAYIDPSVPGPVLELGPGTGTFTEALLQRGISENRLVLVEANPGFAADLQRNFPRAMVLLANAYDTRQWLPHCQQRFNGIVSGLPLLTRPMEERRALIEGCLNKALAGAPFVQFTYMVKPPVPVFSSISVRKGPVTFYNMPPARIWIYRKSDV